MSKRSGGSRRKSLEPVKSALADQPRQRSYSDEFKYTALAAVRLAQGNVHRAAIAMEMPYATLNGWVKDAEAEEASFSENPQGFRLKEKLGDIAVKLEHKLHDVVDSINPDVIRRATLSQRGVFMGIAFDKLRIARGQGLDPDPVSEICRSMGIHRSQLPDVLELEPGQKIPRGFLSTAEVIDVTPEPQTSPNFNCPDCRDSGLLTSTSNPAKSIVCPFCPPLPAPPPSPDTFPSSDCYQTPRSLTCSNCSFTVETTLSLLNTICTECSTGTFQPTVFTDLRCNSCNYAITAPFNPLANPLNSIAVPCPKCLSGVLSPVFDHNFTETGIPVAIPNNSTVEELQRPGPNTTDNESANLLDSLKDDDTEN